MVLHLATTDCTEHIVKTACLWCIFPTFKFQVRKSVLMHGLANLKFKSSLSPQIAFSLSMTLTVTQAVMHSKVITEHVISHRWNWIQCLLRGEQWYAMLRAHLHTAHKICYALGRCVRSSHYAYHQLTKMEAHSYSWVTCLSDTIHSVQHVPLSLLNVLSYCYIINSTAQR
jgi:hypothetical protein